MVSRNFNIREQVFATLPFGRRYGFCWRLNCEMNFIQLHRRPPPPCDTKLSAKFRRSRSSWKRAEMREAATALRYAETTSRMVISRGWAENRLVCPLSLFLFPHFLFWLFAGRNVRLARILSELRHIILRKTGIY